MTQHKRTLSRLYTDPFIWIIVVCACLFWLLLSFYFPITTNLQWPITSPLVFLVPVIVYPILEEIVFRGAVMEFIHEKLPGIFIFHLSKSNIITSILFSSLHFFYHPPIWAAAVFIPSLVFGLLKERYQSLVPPILLHVFFNAGYYWLFYK
ncbi:MAG: JDVT-CTERM system glutamic-type intramembrane protease [Gammaproteobacteria bacterium]